MDNRVVIDSDFCNMIAPGKNIIREKCFVKSIFNSLNLKPVIHIFIFKHEILTNLTIIDLIKENFIEVIDFPFFLTKEWHKIQYTNDFKDYYFYMNSETLSDGFDIFKQHKAQKNMGEIHSLILAHYLNIPIFMSNDTGAKNLAKTKINSSMTQIEVKNVLEVFCDIKKRGSIKLDTKTVRSILKQRTNLNWPQKYKSYS